MKRTIGALCLFAICIFCVSLAGCPDKKVGVVKPPEVDQNVIDDSIKKMQDDKGNGGISEKTGIN